ncbi:FtsH protease activity modulator HflK [Planctomycetaceae bacterium SH139]
MSNARRTPPNLDNLSTYISLGLLALAGFFVIYLLSTGIYKVAEYEKAVVLRFGKLQEPVGPGLHLKLPWIDDAILVDVSERSLRLPWGTSDMESAGRQMRVSREQQEESLILTGDLYAAVVEWNVIWKINDPAKYVSHFNDVETLERTVVAVARSTMHRSVGDYSAEEVLTGKREEVKAAARKEMRDQLAALNCGVDITDLQMQRVTPPQRVRVSFDQVNASIQLRDQLVNEAIRERNQLVPTAEARKDELIREAEGYSARLRAETAGEVAALRSKYEAYKLAPDVTRERMYLETLEKVLAASGPKTILDGDLKGLLPLLNLGEGEQSASGRPLTPTANSRANQPR